MTMSAAFCGVIRWSASGSRIGTLVIGYCPPFLSAAGRWSGRCQRESDLGPHPCTDLGDGRCDLRNVAGAQEEVVLALRQRTELEVDAGGTRPLRALLGV